MEVDPARWPRRDPRHAPVTHYVHFDRHCEHTTSTQSIVTYYTMAVTHDGGLSGGSLAVDEETDLALLVGRLLTCSTDTSEPAPPQDQHVEPENDECVIVPTSLTVAILSQLDSRLSRLDKSIAPLGIRELTRQAANLDAVLEQVSPGASRQARPPVDRGASSNTVASGGASFNDAASSNSGHGGLSASVSAGVGAGAAGMRMSQTFGRLDKPAEPPAPSPMSVMDRTRAVPRTDVLPRWQEGPSNPASPAAAAREDPLATGQERAVIEKGPDIMSLKEYFGALKVVIGDLEQMYQGMVEGRGGTREQGVAELVSSTSARAKRAACVARGCLLHTARGRRPARLRARADSSPHSSRMASIASSSSSSQEPRRRCRDRSTLPT